MLTEISNPFIVQFDPPFYWTRKWRIKLSKLLKIVEIYFFKKLRNNKDFNAVSLIGSQRTLKVFINFMCNKKTQKNL